MSATRTGSFPIGFRSTGNLADEFDEHVQWVKDNGFVGIDCGGIDPQTIKKVLDAGLRVGSVDFPQPWEALVSPDDAKRKDAAKKTSEYIQTVAALGVRNFFYIVMPEKPELERAENLKYTAESLGSICDDIKSTGAKIVLEGWPAGYPYYAVLACTPEGYRAVFDAVGSDVLAVNFDASHLIRMGIDPVRFCEEFVGRIEHVHAKDTELFEEAIYQYGHVQPPTLPPKPHGYGDHNWRYTIPGHGLAPWPRLFAILRGNGYEGMVSIELEDENFTGSKEARQQGLIASRDFLIHA